MMVKSVRWVLLGSVLLVAFGLIAEQLRRVVPCQVLPDALPGPGAPPGPRPIGAVTGVVHDHRGAAVPGARVLAVRRLPDGTWGPPLAVRTGPDGRFRVPVLAPGALTMVIHRDGLAREVRQLRVELGVHDLGLVRLGPGQLIAGQVRDTRGDPVQGALVRATREWDLPQRPAEPPLFGRTDAAGRFRVAGLKAQGYRLWVGRAGYGVSVLRRVQAPAAGVEVVLPLLLELSGQVLAKGQPAAGATVRLGGSGVWPAVTATCDAKGRFRFVDLREGIYELRAVRGSWVSGSSPLIDLQERSQTDLRVILKQGTVLKGQVVDHASSQGLDRVRISVAEELLAISPQATQTGDKGRFSLPPLLPGEYLISLDREGYLPRQGVPVTVLRGDNPELVLTLEKGATLQGIVIDDTGRPVVGARLEIIGRARGSHIADRSGAAISTRESLWERAMQPASPLGEPLPGSLGVTSGLPPVLDPTGPLAAGITGPAASLGVMPGPVPLLPLSDSPGDVAGGRPGLALLRGPAERFATDEKGRFSLTGLPPGTVSLIVRHPSFARHRAGPFRLRAAESRTGLVVRLRPGVTQAGVVLDPIGLPVPGVEVAAAHAGDPFFHVVRTTDLQGGFSLPNLQGTIELRLSAAGFVPLTHRLGLSAPPASPPLITLSLKRADCLVRGQILDPHGLAVVGAAVDFVSLTAGAPSRGAALSDAQGAFEVPGLGRLEYRARVRHPDFPGQRFTLRCPATARFELRYGGGLSFSVQDRRTGERIRAFRYSLKRTGAEMIQREAWAGRAALVPLRAGRYELEVSAPGYATVRRQVQVAEAARPRTITRRGLVIALELAGSVSGHVRDQHGLAAAEVRVSIAGQEASTDARGAFTVSGVPAGTHVLSATHPDLGTGRLNEVTVGPGLPTVGLIVDLAPGSRAPKGVVSGVAVRLALSGEAVRISSVRPGSAAEQSGVRTGDELVSVQGRDLDGLGVSDIAALLRGPTGTRVVLELRRGDSTLKVSVKRELLR